MIATARRESPFLPDGAALAALFAAGEETLVRNLQAINAINAFPVPDNDSGINMHFTWKAAAQAAEQAARTGGDAATVAARAARAALLAARGNSGVILSQVVAGLAAGFRDCREVDAAHLAMALTEASQRADRSVAKPVEGTILTVARDAAMAAQGAANEGGDVLAVLEQASRQAWLTLARTPELLPVLKEAGVVDSGGLGLCHLLTALHQRALQLAFGLAAATGERATDTPDGYAATDSALQPLASGRYGHEVMFLLEGTRLDTKALQEALSEMGDSLLVVGDETLVKVHIHTLEPHRVITFAHSAGKVSDLTLEDLDAQVAAVRQHPRD